MIISRKTIPLSVPVFYGKEARYVQECIESGWVSTAGPWVTRFENEFAAKVGTKGAVSVSSGTAALHLALILAGVGPEDEVLVPTLTFIATINAVKYVGATPVFFDCDDHLGFSVDHLERFLKEECRQDGHHTLNKKTGHRVKALIPVHIFGFPAGIPAMMKVVEQYGLKVIEDATEALGSTYLNNRKMAGTLGHIGCFSFNGNKIITSGGGGMLVSDDEALLAKARYLSTQAKDDEIFYIHGDIGYNYRLTSLQAALGIAQLENIDAIVETKRRNVELYNTFFEGCGFGGILKEAPHTRANYWLTTFIFNEEISLRDCVSALSQEKIQARPVWTLNHLQKSYRACEAYRIENALGLYPRIVNLPSSSDLTEQDIARVVNSVKDFWNIVKKGQS